MGRSDPGPQKYKESSKIESKFYAKDQDKYWADLILKAKSRDIIARYNTTPGDKFTSKHPIENRRRFIRSKSEHDCSIIHNEYYLKHNLYIKSAVEKPNVLNFQMKKASFRDYTPKILSQEVNMGMWI